MIRNNLKESYLKARLAVELIKHGWSIKLIGHVVGHWKLTKDELRKEVAILERQRTQVKRFFFF